MEKKHFQDVLQTLAPIIEKIKMRAHALHDSVAQTYGASLPYSVHLDAVAGYTAEYAWEVCARDEDIAPIMFGAYFHDSIEDARLTYNNVQKIAGEYLSEEQAVMAAEIAYALTNEKGRTRAERANEKYYQGIRTTPYAPLVKMADRLANTAFSANGGITSSPRMHELYKQEMPHFIASVAAPTNDPRCAVPTSMITAINSLL